MPISMVDVHKIGKVERPRHSKIMETEEWKGAIRKIEAGLKPSQGMKIVLTSQATRKIGKNAARILKYQLQKYVRSKKLDLDVFFRGQDEATGLAITYVTVKSKK